MIRGARYIVSINRTFFWMYPHDCELCTLLANQAESFNFAPVELKPREALGWGQK